MCNINLILLFFVYLRPHMYDVDKRVRNRPRIIKQNRIKRDLTLAATENGNIKRID